MQPVRGMSLFEWIFVSSSLPLKSALLKKVQFFCRHLLFYTINIKPIYLDWLNKSAVFQKHYICFGKNYKHASIGKIHSSIMTHYKQPYLLTLCRSKKNHRIWKRLSQFQSSSNRFEYWSFYQKIAQLSINGVGLTKPLTTSLNPTSEHSSHLKKPSKGGR